MPRIFVPDGVAHITERVYASRPDYGRAAAEMYTAASSGGDLSPREHEMARYRIAILNGCLLCQSFRAPEAVAAGFTDAHYAKIDSWRESDLFTPRERLAAEFAELFVVDHQSLDDEFFATLKQTLTDEEILDLVFVCARYMAFGRLTHVLGLDDSCSLSSDARVEAY